jgi:hypothetical protein
MSDNQEKLKPVDKKIICEKNKKKLLTGKKITFIYYLVAEVMC